MKLRAMLLGVMILAVAGPASACFFGTVNFTADCSGWSACGTIVEGTDPVDVRIVLRLMQGDLTIAEIRDTVAVNTSTWDFCMRGAWDTELCGDYRVMASLWLMWPTPDGREFDVSFNCPCDEGGCHFTPGYWKNHEENWPVTSLVIGGVTYNQSQLLDILNTPTRKDATIICAHHLIAAMLNVANGADDSIQGAIDAANALLTTYPIGSNPPKPQRQSILNVKDELADYNELVVPGCEEDLGPCPDGIRKSALNPTSEKSTWGAIKDMYR